MSFLFLGSVASSCMSISNIVTVAAGYSKKRNQKCPADHTTIFPHPENRALLALIKIRSLFPFQTESASEEGRKTKTRSSTRRLQPRSQCAAVCPL